ncbi:MAG: hypothetical protein E6R05_02305 [Candidatus Moraniibacteriota bacterium]|nr:MAG: hypothetical protein E6R05_02305 [Candidatus Moranbacteria bacterium]
MTQMKAHPTGRFFPTSIVGLGLALWLILTIDASRAEIAANNYDGAVIVYGVVITALAMAFVAGWSTLLVTLVINWGMAGRRSMFWKQLLEWSTLFGVITILAVWSLFYLES